MGHVLLTAPSIERFHLHEQLARAMQRRGHRVSVLATDPVTRRCYGLHGLPAILLEKSRGEVPDGFELNALAARDLRLAGVFRPSLRALRQQRRRLEARVAAALRIFETDLPDLAWFHDRRDGLGRLLHHIARNYGVATVHTGPGCLPGTMQRDPDGVDGDSRAAARAAIDYRRVVADRELCDAGLATALGGPAGVPPRRPLLPPDSIDSVASLIDGLRRRELRGSRHRMQAWRSAATPRRAPFLEKLKGLPRPPFAALLLQDPTDPRLRLDADAVMPDIAQLIKMTEAAARAYDPELKVVALPPDMSLRLRAATAATAAVAVTVNDPLAMTAVLAGTPLVHFGHARYGLPGVAHRASPATIGDQLALALGPDQPTLRLRFLTRSLREDHIWCDPIAPDVNGLSGLVADFEARIDRATPALAPLDYREGPDFA